METGNIPNIRLIHKFIANRVVEIVNGIVKTSEFEKSRLNNLLEEAEKEIKNTEINDQKKYLIDQKIEVLKSLSIN